MTTALVSGFRGLSAATLADYNAYVAEQIGLWHSAFTKVGLTRDTSITGQLDPTAVVDATTLPAVSNYTDRGYTWYKFTDPLAATEPVFIRVTWNVKNGATSATFNGALAPKFEVGIQSGQAGANAFLGNPAIANFQSRSADSPDIKRDYGFFCYTGDYFMVALPGYANSQTAGWLTVERWKDPTGIAPATKGIVTNYRVNQTTGGSLSGGYQYDACVMTRRNDGVSFPDPSGQGSPPFPTLSQGQGVSEVGKIGALWRPMLSERGYTVENTLFTRMVDYPFAAQIAGVGLISGGTGTFLALNGLSVGNNYQGTTEARVVRYD